jgi:uncharacterized protein (DUF849 family)
MSPYLPITPAQIAESSIQAAQAGAAIIHLHARDPVTGQPSANPDHFMEFLPRIKAGCDAVINISTGGSSLMSLDERLAPARLARAEMCSLNMGTMNFGIFPLLERYSGWQHEWEPRLLEATRGVPFTNTFENIEVILDDLGRDKGARFEFECYDMGQIETLAFYLRQGRVQAPLYVQFVLGVLGGVGASAENLAAMKACADRLLGDQYEFSVLAAGAMQMRLATMGAVMGGNVRVGLEDSLSIGPRELARSNAEQVSRIRLILEALNMEIATADEARERLQTKGKDNQGF